MTHAYSIFLNAQNAAIYLYHQNITCMEHFQLKNIPYNVQIVRIWDMIIVRYHYKYNSDLQTL